jgi:hypothetical protein
MVLVNEKVLHRVGQTNSSIQISSELPVHSRNTAVADSSRSNARLCGSREVTNNQSEVVVLGSAPFLHRRQDKISSFGR